jgi:hypothetical protein
MGAHPRHGASLPTSDGRQLSVSLLNALLVNFDPMNPASESSDPVQLHRECCPRVLSWPLAQQQSYAAAALKCPSETARRPLIERPHASCPTTPACAPPPPSHPVPPCEYSSMDSSLTCQCCSKIVYAVPCCTRCCGCLHRVIVPNRCRPDARCTASDGNTHCEPRRDMHNLFISSTCPLLYMCIHTLRGP